MARIYHKRVCTESSWFAGWKAEKYNNDLLKPCPKWRCPLSVERRLFQTQEDALVCRAHQSAGLGPWLPSRSPEQVSQPRLAFTSVPALSDAGTASWEERCRTAAPPASGTGVWGAPAPWPSETGPAPASGLGTPAALRRPAGTQDDRLRSNAETGPAPNVAPSKRPAKTSSHNAKVQKGSLKRKSLREQKQALPFLTHAVCLVFFKPEITGVSEGTTKTCSK